MYNNSRKHYPLKFIFALLASSILTPRAFAQSSTPTGTVDVGDNGQVTVSGGATTNPAPPEPGKPLNSVDAGTLSTSGSLTITGPDTTSDIGSGNINISPTGTLNIKGGTTVNVTNGGSTGDNGTLNVTGNSTLDAGNYLNADGTVMVDDSTVKAGTLNVGGPSGAIVTLQNNTTATFDNTTVGIPGSGTLNIDKTKNVSLGALEIGYNDQGTVNITDSQVAAGTTAVGLKNQYVNSKGILSVDNSTLNITGDTSIAGNNSDFKVIKSGTVTVSGNTAVGVGGAEPGTLEVNGDSHFTTGSLTVGTQGGTGMVSIGDPKEGSGHLTSNGLVIVGDTNSTGTLDIKNGSDVSIANWGGLTIGEGTGSTGTINVDGSGSRLVSGDAAEQGGVENLVGHGNGDGKATLSVSNGGSASFLGTGGLTIGFGTYSADTRTHTEANGVVNVDGTGSALKVQGGKTTIGDGGTGALNITNGGSAMLDGAKGLDVGESIYTGYSADSELIPGTSGNGKVVVDGKNSNLTVGNGGPSPWYYGVQIGSTGTGELDVTNGGTATFGNGGLIAGGGAKDLEGTDHTGTGHIFVNDGTLTINGGDGDVAHGTYIGHDGTGTLDIANKGTVTINGSTGLTIGGEWNDVGGNGTVTIENADSKLTVNDGKTTIGQRGTGTLKITDSGSADFGNGGLDVGEADWAEKNGVWNPVAGTAGTGTVEVSNASLTVDGETQIGNAGNGTMTIENNSQATFNNNVTIGNYAGSNGTLELKDNSALNPYKLNPDGSVTTAIGNGEIVIGNQSGSTGTVNVTDSTLYNQNHNLIVGNAGTGTMTVSGQGSQVYTQNGFNGFGLIVGNQQGGTGNVTFQDGANYTAWSNNTLVGNNGTGTLTFTGAGTTGNFGLWSVGLGDGETGKGKLDVSNGANVGKIATVSLGSSGNAVGDLEVTGGSSLTANAITTSNNENNRINIDGSKVTLESVINGGPLPDLSLNGGVMNVSGNSSVNLNADTTQSGAGSSFPSFLSVSGGNAGNATLNISGESTLDVGSKGEVIAGSTSGKTGTINISGGSSLDGGNLVLGQNGGTGIVNVTDTGSKLTLSKSILLGDSGTGTINISGKDNSLSSSNIMMGVAQNGHGVLNMNDSTTLNASGQIVHGEGTAEMSFTNATLNATGNLYDNVDTSLSGQNTINTNSNNLYLDSKISGSGGFDKTGSGILQINNISNDYHGTTNINQGILQGIGTIGGALNIGNGTTLRAGISSDPSVQYGKMQVNGNTVMETGSTMEANLGIYPQASGLNDSGSFTIQDGSTLKTVVAEGAQLKINQAYDVVHADGGVNGKFTTYKQDGKIGSDASDGYSVVKGDTGHPEYDKNDVKITLSFDKDKHDHNGNSGIGYNGDRNQTGMGDRLNPSVGGNTPLSGLANILVGSDNEQRLHNLTQLDGEIASDMRTGNINNNFWVRDSVNNRLDCLEDTFRQIGNGQTTSSNVCGVTGKKVNVWGNMYGGVGGQNGHSGWDYAAKAKDNDAGFIWGVDGEIGSDGYAEDRWHVGMMMGYGSVMESASGVSSSGESNNANIGMYFGKQVRFDNQNFFTFHGQFGYTWNIMSWHRSVNLEGAASQYNQSLHANELGGTAHVNAEIAYKHVFNLWGTPLEVAPTGSITYLNYEQGSYHEHGGDLALQGRATNTNMGYGFMGVKLATNFNIGNVVITPHGKFGYRRSFGANQSYTHVGFEALGGGNTGIDPSIVGVPVVQDQALTELGFDVHPTDYLTFGANYVGLYGGHEQTMSGGQLSAKIAF